MLKTVIFGPIPFSLIQSIQVLCTLWPRWPPRYIPDAIKDLKIYNDNQQYVRLVRGKIRSGHGHA